MDVAHIRPVDAAPINQLTLKLMRLLTRRVPRLLMVCVCFALGALLSHGIAALRAESQVATDFTAALTADLAAAAIVFQGTVVDSRPAKNATTGVITNTITIQRTVVLKGSFGSGTTKTITVPGGTVGDLTMDVDSTPLVSKDHRVIVLLDSGGNPMPGRFLYRLGKNDVVDDTPGLTLNDVRGLL